MTSHLTELVPQAAAGAGERVALVDAGSGRRLTWSELEVEVDRVAGGLDSLGLVPGHRVVLALPNRLEFVTSYLGALRAGLVAVPVNPRASTGELARLLVDCGARAVVADPTTVGSVRQAAVPRVVVVEDVVQPGETAYDALAGRTPQASPAGGDPERLAVLLYTSGTSGRPRAAMLSHRALLANIEQVAAVEPPLLTGDDVVLGVLPLFHVYGLNAVLGQVLRRRARLVLVDGFDAEDTLAVIEDEAVSVLPVAPPALAHWQEVPDLGERLSGVRLVLSGSAPLSRELVAEFTARTGLPVHQGYGLTEAGPVVTSTWCSTRSAAALSAGGSLGPPLPGVEVRLVDADGGSPEGSDPGEVLVRGANLFSGFWPDGSEGPDEDGWYATGDVGLLDEEGGVLLVDRLKELVIVSGFNVYPHEVEDVVAEVAGVAECAVIGTSHRFTGEAVVAYVRAVDTPPGAAGDLEDRVRAHCAVRLARFKQPTEILVVAELPHTRTGKVAKGRLRHRRAGTPGLLE